MQSQPLSNVQEELLKLYSQNLSQEELKELKTVLGKYFAYKSTKEADKIWDNKKYSNETMDAWLNEG
jgi:butyrate kinase